MVRQRKFSAEFRVEAVRLMRERIASGDTLSRVGQELDINPDLLRAWEREIEAAPPDASPQQVFPGKGQNRSYERRKVERKETAAETPDQELKRLRREVERLRQERDFLKKAAAFFAKESQ
jgi:transposase